MKNFFLTLFIILSLQLFSQENKTYKIGDFAQGGIIFWLDDSGQHGLVCAKEDFSELVPWDTQLKTAAEGTRTVPSDKAVVSAFGDGIYSGEMNTAIIVAALGFGDGRVYAATVCNELQVIENEITYGDWYLPSRMELVLMYKNRKLIDRVALENGGGIFMMEGDFLAIGNDYWSSTEFFKRDKMRTPDHVAWIHNFKKGGESFQTPARKYITCSVRAIRAF